MKKKIITLLLALIALSAEAQFLYRINGGGLKEPSFMLGTIHCLPGTLLDSIPEFAKAEAKCQQLYVETIPWNHFRAREKQPEQQSKTTELKYPVGKNIFDFIDKESADILIKKFKEVMHADLRDTMIIDFRTMLPSYFLDFLYPSFLDPIMNGFMDGYCMEKASERGLNICELDDEDLNIKDLVPDYHEKKKPLSIEEQADSLMSFLKGYDERQQTLINHVEEMRRYWLTGDLEGLANSKLQDIDQHPSAYKVRNEKWLPKMQVAMREKPTMFVFGAGHMAGSTGIIAILRKAGYKVKRVKSSKR